MKRLTVVLAAAAIALGGCGAAPGDDLAEDPVPGDEPTATPPPPAEEPAIIETPPDRDAPDGLEGETISGTLGGDSQLEGGCAWVDAGGARFEVLYPEGYRIEWGPLRLIGPDGEVIAEDGDEITVTGSRAEDLMSLCQVGVIFEASEVEAGAGS